MLTSIKYCRKWRRRRKMKVLASLMIMEIVRRINPTSLISIYDGFKYSINVMFNS